MSTTAILDTPRAGTAATAWMRALELTAPIARNRYRTLPTVIDEVAARQGDAPALLSDRETFTYRALAERAHKYARWALANKLAKGDVVCLLMPNRPEYLAIWLGLTSVGVIVSLLNTNLAGPSLAHCIRIVSPKQIVAAAECVESLTLALDQIETPPSVWVHGSETAAFPRIDTEIVDYSAESLSTDERRPPEIEDMALYIYTSGTTGMPKAARVSHARVMQWSHWFAGMMEVTPTDRLYNCLPIYHSVGGVQATGAMLVGGGSVVIREKFSASQFWSDIVRWDCTLFQYIGELCRYLLHTAPVEFESAHRVRLACGNGLSPDVWDAFTQRFHLPRILEFYAATEGNLSLFNVEGKCGAIGHVPAYLAHRFSPTLILLNADTTKPERNQQGFCIRCMPNQPGEAIGKMVTDPASAGSRFDGYTSEEDSEKKILRNVFEPGDAWIRSGDLLRKDEQGFYYFVDRVGDTFRRKGENVANSEVSAVLCEFPGVEHANVYGVRVPGLDGKVGMATLVAGNQLDLAALRKHLSKRLPPYARPVFLRICAVASLTSTFKYSKTKLVRQAYDPAACSDPLYFDLAGSETFVELNKALFDQIQSGEVRL
jgi:fatty-acyl-CoA synthase